MQSQKEKEIERAHWLFNRRKSCVNNAAQIISCKIKVAPVQDLCVCVCVCRRVCEHVSAYEALQFPQIWGERNGNKKDLLDLDT